MIRLNSVEEGYLVSGVPVFHILNSYYMMLGARILDINNFLNLVRDALTCSTKRHKRTHGAYDPTFSLDDKRRF
jgi:hypothetical protein